MAKNRKGTISILLDLHYKYPMNTFEEFYGDTVSYSEVEQFSYIDLKEMVFENINRKIKFRKFGRQGGILTVKMDILPKEYEIFLKIFKGEYINKETEKENGETQYIKFNFLHDFEISNLRKLTREEKIKFKKPVAPIAEDEEDSDNNED